MVCATDCTQFATEGNLEPFIETQHDVIVAALRVILDRNRHPVLVHCNKGNHRTGCLIGCLRKLMHWSLTATFEEVSGQQDRLLRPPPTRTPTQTTSNTCLSQS
jgi:hypothetical protein